jgi:hypothetical protein
MRLDKPDHKPKDEERDDEACHVNREIHDAVPMKHGFVSEPISSFLRAVVLLPMVGHLSLLSRTMRDMLGSVNG